MRKKITQSKVESDSMTGTFRFLMGKKFWQRWGLPFIIIFLMGIITYLGSVIGRYNAEQKNIESIISTSYPKEEFVIIPPGSRDIKKWGTFHFAGGGDVLFRYPLNWRIESTGVASLIREGEEAVVAADFFEQPTDESTLLTYRVSRISALEETGYNVTDIFDTYVDGVTAIVISYTDSDNQTTFYETVIPQHDELYRMLLVIKNNRRITDIENVISEYKMMLATMAFPL